MSGDPARPRDADDSAEDPRWNAAQCSVIGASHRRAGTPNQDACLIRQPVATEALIAVADGHGSSEYSMSAVGARLACDVAQQAGEDVLDRLRGEDGPAQVLALKRDVEEALARQVVNMWRERVAAHIRLVSAETVRAVPALEEEEAADAAPYAEPSREPPQGAHEAAVAEAAEPPAPDVRRYGSTLVFALLAEAWSLFFQLGDGDLALVDDAGRVRFPLPPDPLLIGTTTTSLVMPDAWRHARVAVVPAERFRPRVVLAATDGLASSFENPSGMQDFLRAVEQLVGTASVPAVEERLRHVLDRYSAQGSGDDMTVAAAWRRERDAQTTVRAWPQGGP